MSVSTLIRVLLAMPVNQIRDQMRAELGLHHRALPTLQYLEITERDTRGAIKLTPLDAARAGQAQGTPVTRRSPVA